MLFTLTKDQYQRYKDTAGPCRQYILDKYPRLCSIVDTFNNYFGAENVDIYGNGFKQKSLLLRLLEDYEDSSPEQESLEEYLEYRLTRLSMFENLAIYVHWPSVTVTNERNQSVVVRDLYAKVPLFTNGKLIQGFQLTRATYSYEQYSSGYMHSHVNGIHPDPSEFMFPCLGTGPLIRTQNSLSSDVNSDLWDLFCAELDRYVHVESIAGVPYRHLDRIGTGVMNEVHYAGYRMTSFRYINANDNVKELFDTFFKYILVRKKMRFGFNEGMFISAYTNTQWILKLSNEFLKFFAIMTSLGKTDVTQTELLREGILKDVKASNDKLYTLSPSRRGMSNYRGFIGLHVLYFKGEDIKTHVDEPVNFIENTYYVLSPVLALAFLDQCLNYLNIYEHEKNKNVIQEESEVISGASDSSASGENHEDIRTNHPFGEKRVAISI